MASDTSSLFLAISLEVRQMVYRFVALDVRIRCRESGVDKCEPPKLHGTGRSAKAPSKAKIIKSPLSILLVNHQTRNEARHYMYEDIVCGIVRRLNTSYYYGGLFEALIDRTRNAETKLTRTRHLVVRMRDMGSMLGTPPGYHSFDMFGTPGDYQSLENRGSLLSGPKSVKIVVDQGHDMDRICQPWGIDHESKTLTVGTKQDAVAVLNKDHVVGLYNGKVLARLIEQGCFDQKVKIMFEVHISPRKALLMKVDKDWKVDMEVVWKKNAVGSSIWF